MPPPPLLPPSLGLPREPPVHEQGAEQQLPPRPTRAGPPTQRVAAGPATASAPAAAAAVRGAAAAAAGPGGPRPAWPQRQHRVPVPRGDRDPAGHGPGLAGRGGQRRVRWALAAEGGGRPAFGGGGVCGCGGAGRPPLRLHWVPCCARCGAPVGGRGRAACRVPCPGHPAGHDAHRPLKLNTLSWPSKP